MSKITLAPNASGTGTLTVEAPNTNSDYTLTLPAETGTVLTSGGAIDVNASAPADSVAIDASGNVGIANTVASTLNAVSGAGNLVVGSGSGNKGLSVYSGTAGLGSICFADGTTTTSTYTGYITYNHSSNHMEFGTNGGSERMRIDSSGNLLVGTTTRFTTGGFLPKVTIDAGSDGIAIPNIGNGYTALITKAGGSYNYYAGYFLNSSNSLVGSISCTTSSTAYNTSSDYRLKENIAPMTGALATVAQLNPVTYTWKADGSAGQGFIAHELQAVVPDCVTGEKDAEREVDVFDEEGNKTGTKMEPVYQGVDTSFLVATLTAAIQELSAKNDALEARIAALEAA